MSIWLLHRAANRYFGPFTTELDARTAATIAIDPDCFEVLTGDELAAYRQSLQ